MTNSRFPAVSMWLSFKCKTDLVNGVFLKQNLESASPPTILTSPVTKRYVSE